MKFIKTYTEFMTGHWHSKYANNVYILFKVLRDQAWIQDPLTWKENADYLYVFGLKCVSSCQELKRHGSVYTFKKKWESRKHIFFEVNMIWMEF